MFRGDGMELGLSFYEIYGGQCYDLLNNRQLLQVLEDKHNNVIPYFPLPLTPLSYPPFRSKSNRSPNS